MIINRGDDAGLDQLRLHYTAVTRYIFIVVLNFVALDGEPRVITAVVSSHIIVLESQDVEGETEAQVFVAVIGEPSGSEPLGLSDVRRFLNTRRNIGTDVAHRDSLNRSDEGQLYKVDAQRRSPHHLMIIGSGKVPQGLAVGLGHLPEEIHSCHPACASHVLWNQSGLSRYMLREMARNDSSFDIRRPAGSKIDDEVYIFPLVKWPFRRQSWY